MGGGRRKERPKPETLDPSTGRWSAGVQRVGDCDGDERLWQHQIANFGLAPRGSHPWCRSDFACRSFQVSRARYASEASGRETGSAGDVGSRSAHFPHIATNNNMRHFANFVARLCEETHRFLSELPMHP